MDKELHDALAQVTMYSKMGRYISNKILKYNKRTKTHRSLRNSEKPQPELQDYVKLKKVREKSAVQSHHSSHFKVAHTLSNMQPSIGYYKVNYCQIQKSPRSYDFNRSVPHFNRQKFFCNEAKPVLVDIPDSVICQHRVKGLTQLKRMTGRDQIKGSIRKQIQDPHQNRFKLIKDLNSIELKKSGVHMDKDLPRGATFGNLPNTPQNDYNIKIPYKRLDTHIVPFERTLGRSELSMNCEKGIANYFNEYQFKQQQKVSNWKKMLPREKTGLLPSYMDKNINTRSSIGLLNLKTLQMNCSEINRPPMKDKKKARKPIVFIEQMNEDDKQNAINNY